MEFIALVYIIGIHVSLFYQFMVQGPFVHSVQHVIFVINMLIFELLQII